MTAAIQHIKANGLSFAYLEDGAGPLVLCVHGFPDTPHTWDATMPALARAGFRAVAPWTRGYAPTEIPADGAYDVETLGKDLLALIEAFGERSAIVVAHDWGAAAAYAAVGLDPARIKFLVTVGIPHPAAIRPTPAMIWRARHFFTLSRKNAAAKIRKGDYRHIDELVQRWSPAWKVPPGETDAVKRAFREPGCLEAALGYYKAFSTKLPPSLRAKVSVPSAVFAGEHDNLPVSLYEKARRRYAGPYDVIAVPGGHFMHREHPDRFVPELVRVVTAAR